MLNQNTNSPRGLINQDFQGKTLFLFLPTCPLCRGSHILGSLKSMSEYKETTGCKPCPLPKRICNQAPGVRREILPPEGACIFSLQVWLLFSWLVDNPSACSFKENCVFPIEPQGYTLTALCMFHLAVPEPL